MMQKKRSAARDGINTEEVAANLAELITKGPQPAVEARKPLFRRIALLLNFC